MCTQNQRLYQNDSQVHLIDIVQGTTSRPLGRQYFTERFDWDPKSGRPWIGEGSSVAFPSHRRRHLAGSNSHPRIMGPFRRLGARIFVQASRQS